jgi:hypothetical protein
VLKQRGERWRLLGDPQLCDWGWLAQVQREELNDEWSRIDNAYVVADFRLTRQSSGLALVLAFVFESMGLRDTPARRLPLMVIDEIHQT